MSGKGSRQRESQVPKETLEANWNRTFGLLREIGRTLPSSTLHGLETHDPPNWEPQKPPKEKAK